MSSKKAKVNLKNAKQAIQGKDFEAALVYCQDVLDEDGLNYNALVFAGLCHSELRHHELAFTSYKQASECQPDNALAYQGIVNLFSKHNMKGNPEQISVLISAYQFLLNQTKLEPAKKLEFLNGLSQAYCDNSQFSLALNTLHTAEQDLEKLSSLNHTPTQLTLLKCLKQAVDDYDQLDFQPQFIYKVMSDLMQNEEGSQNDREDALKHLFMVLTSKQGCLKDYLPDIKQLCIKLVNQDFKNRLFGEVAIQINLQESFSDPSDDMKKVLESCDSAYQSMYQGYQMYYRNKLEDCQKLLQEGLQSASDFVPGWLILSKCLNKMHQGNNAEKAAKTGLQECKKLHPTKRGSWIAQIQPLGDLKLELTQCLATALASQHNPTSLNLAKSTYEKLSNIPAYSKHAVLGLVAVEAKLENWDSVKDILAQNPSAAEDVNAKCWQAQLQFQDGDKEGAIISVKSLVSDHQNNLLATLTLGKLMWKSDLSYRRDKTKCLATFLKAAKLDVYHGETFLYLGHYYCQVADDKTRGKKCYQKAYALDEGSEDAGSALADLYVAEGNFDDAVALYEGVTSVAVPGTCKWAWLRLGLCRLKMKDGNSAIKCFLSALRADANDYICWECLGEGYVGRGSYGAAWKAFNKAHELNPNSVYSVFQMATVKQILGQHVEAITEYEDVLKIIPDYVPALKGLGESHLAQARQMLTEGRDQTCCDHVAEAIRYLTSAISSSGNMSCLWKLLGECCNVLHVLHESQVKIDVPNVLRPERSGDNLAALNKQQMLALGSKCFSQAISLHDNLSSLWHDLGMNLFYRAKEETDLSLATQLAEKSQNALQKAISLEAGDHIVWNSLGVVAASKYIENWALAQHSFIKSIEADANNCWAWSNLGSMYLLQSQVQLAHQAFKVAQSLEPSFPNSWIGQALVAESVGSEEAMDLFRHATELGLHGQSGTAYASWVARVVSECEDRSTQRYRENIHDMNAISTSLPQTYKYCERHPDSAWALTLHGFILEQSGLNRSAEEVYRRAVDIIQLEFDEKCHPSSLSAKLNKAKANYARMLCANGKYREAVQAFQTISSPDFHDLCGLALALRQSGDHKQAMKVYEDCGRMVAAEDKRADLAVAMATLCFEVKDDKHAKELLRPWVKSSVAVKFTLAAIDILRDSTSEEMTSDLSDLSELTAARDVTMRQCLLVVASLLRHDERAACRALQKYVHRYPHDWRFRVLLSQLIQTRTVNISIGLSHVMALTGLNNYVTDDSCSSVNRDLARRSGKQSSKEHRLATIVNSLSLLSCGKHVFDGGTGSGDYSSLKSAQRLAHCHPYCTKSWSVLSASCYAQSVCSKWLAKEDRLDSVCHRLSSYVEENTDSNELKHWSTKLKIISLITSEKFDEVAQVAEQITDDFEETDFYMTLCECAKELKTSGNINKSLIGELKSIATSKSASFHCKTAAAHVLKCAGMHREAYDILGNATTTPFTNSDRAIITGLRSLAVAFAAAQNPSSDQSNQWVALCVDAVNSTKVVDRTGLTMLAEGLCRYMEKNHRKCRVMLNRFLNNDDVRRPCGELCIARNAAAWYLYRILHDRNDSMEMEKFLEKWSGNPYVRRIVKLLPRH